MGAAMLPANGIDICVETFGERTDPPLLLIAGGASSMDWWEDEFCRRLAAGGRYVIRYDHRDTGRSTSFPAGDPPYSTEDLAADALGLLDAMGVTRAHIVGLSLGGALAQRIAVEHPARVRTLTLMATGPAVDDQNADLAGRATRETDWNDRRAAVDRIVADTLDCAGPLIFDEGRLRRLAERVFDRTPDMAASRANHWLAAPGAPIRDRLGEITAPTLILQGTEDQVFGMAAAEALEQEIAGARVITLTGVGHEFPPRAVWDVVLTATLEHTA
jgi:pimeloyl-ACP methyl ester carboxylesterase